MAHVLYTIHIYIYTVAYHFKSSTEKSHVILIRPQTTPVTTVCIEETSAQWDVSWWRCLKKPRSLQWEAPIQLDPWNWEMHLQNVVVGQEMDEYDWKWLEKKLTLFGKMVFCWTLDLLNQCLLQLEDYAPANSTRYRNSKPLKEMMFFTHYSKKTYWKDIQKLKMKPHSSHRFN